MEVKERIVIESLKLFMRYGIKSVTMDRIADNLGVSKRTIYELFNDKDGLVENCINHLTNEEKKISKGIISRSDNVIDAFITRMQRSIELMSSANEMFFYDIEKYHYSVFKCSLRKQNEDEFTMLLNFIKQGKKEEYFRQDINEEILARLIKEQLRIITNNDIFPPGRFDKVDVFKNISINFIRGIATQKGIEILENYTY